MRYFAQTVATGTDPNLLPAEIASPHKTAVVEHRLPRLLQQLDSAVSQLSNSPPKPLAHSVVAGVLSPSQVADTMEALPPPQQVSFLDGGSSAPLLEGCHGLIHDPSASARASP